MDDQFAVRTGRDALRWEEWERSEREAWPPRGGPRHIHRGEGWSLEDKAASQGAAASSARPRLALIAQDGERPRLLLWIEAQRGALARCELFCADAVADDVAARCPELTVKRVRNAPMGGDQQIGAMIAEGRIDGLVAFIDASTAGGGGFDSAGLMRLAMLYDRPMACGPHAAEVMLRGLAADPASGDLERRPASASKPRPRRETFGAVQAAWAWDQARMRAAQRRAPPRQEQDPERGTHRREGRSGDQSGGSRLERSWARASQASAPHPAQGGRALLVVGDGAPVSAARGMAAAFRALGRTVDICAFGCGVGAAVRVRGDFGGASLTVDISDEAAAARAMAYDVSAMLTAPEPDQWPEARGLLDSLNRTGAPIITVGEGVMALAAAGLARGRRIAAPPGCVSALRGAGANVARIDPMGVVVDGALITLAGWEAALADAAETDWLSAAAALMARPRNGAQGIWA